MNLRAALVEGVSQTQGPWMAVGEEGVVHLELYNPLQTQLQLDRLTLSVTFTAAVAAGDKARPGDSCAVVAAGESSGGGGVAKTAGCQDMDKDLQEQAGGAVLVEHKDLSLAAGGRYVVAMRMTAREPGTIRVTGLVWRLGGVVTCTHEV